jgi:inhibitor of KinA sporulation pathway (predicted exonuclease)
MSDQKEIFCALDLEFNQQEDAQGNRSSKIIQIGICIGNIFTSAIYEKRRWYVNIDEALNPRIVRLTGVTEDHLSRMGMPLDRAYKELCSVLAFYDCERNPITWGGNDGAELRRQLGLSEDEFVFGRCFFDMRTVLQWYCLSRGIKKQSGLAKSMLKVGLKFDGRKHDAMDDASNTFRIACKLLGAFGETDRAAGPKPT